MDSHIKSFKRLKLVDMKFLMRNFLFTETTSSP